MNRAKWTAAAVVAAASLVVTAAHAQPSANVTSCLNLAGQVKSALESNQSSPNYTSAQAEQRYGREFCTNGFYQNGMNHYAQALKLLGTPSASASGQSTSGQS